MKRLLLGAAIAALSISAAQADWMTDRIVQNSKMYNDPNYWRQMHEQNVREKEQRDRAEAERAAVRRQTYEQQKERERTLYNQHLADEEAAREEAAKRRAEDYAIQTDHERALAEQKAKEFEQQQAERKRVAEAKAADDAKPSNVLFRAYTSYIYVKLCNQIREGYAVQYVNDMELERATKVIKTIKAKAVENDPNIDTDYAWNEGMKEAQRLLSNNAMGTDQCHWVYGNLLSMSPTTPYTITKPD